jgi:hypothetical protein
MKTVRVFPQPIATKNILSTQANGRSYLVANGMQDVSDIDAAVLGANGWCVYGMVGPTSGRPTATDPDMGVTFGAATKYIDTTIGAVIQWDGSAWRNVLTGATV